MHRRIWLRDIFVRLTMLMVVLSFLILYFYIVGNMQGFTDRMLTILINIESWVLSLTALSAAFSIITCVFTMPFTKVNLAKIIFSVAAFVVSLLLSIGISILQSFMDGYSFF